MLVKSSLSKYIMWNGGLVSNLFIVSDTTVSCPPFADSITEGDMRWEKAVGDFVNVDDTVGEVETDKVFYTYYIVCCRL